jgi:hypothetical protein
MARVGPQRHRGGGTTALIYSPGIVLYHIHGTALVNRRVKDVSCIINVDQFY